MPENTPNRKAPLWPLASSLAGRLARILTISILFAFRPPSLAQDINTILMQSTFRISGPSAKTPGELNYGTAFIVGLPMAPNSIRSFYVLVTAAHVLKDIKGETATIDLRHKNTDGTYSELPTTFTIRNMFQNLYETSLEADVAVAFISLPPGAEIHPVPISFFVTDDRLTQLEIHPGDDFFVLGFPLYASLHTFPVLRSGILSSYPITPMKTVMQYYLNFKVFPGNSGGPIYFDFASRSYLSGATVVRREWGIFGLVADQLTSSASGVEESLDIAEIVPGIYITESISRLGDRPLAKNTLVPLPSSGNRRWK
jgi:hypothetical protein